MDEITPHVEPDTNLFDEHSTLFAKYFCCILSPSSVSK